MNFVVHSLGWSVLVRPEESGVEEGEDRSIE
jgi:hypothetical protein